ncbi:MAG: DNA-directed RNA polymerase subunit omega [Candidatus Omnitrophota bacterium]
MEHIKLPPVNPTAAQELDILKLAAESARVSPKTSVVDISLEEILDSTGSIYKLCNLAAKRALELSEGAPKLVSVESTKLTTLALAEIRAKKVKYKVREKENN